MERVLVSPLADLFKYRLQNENIGLNHSSPAACSTKADVRSTPRKRSRHFLLPREWRLASIRISATSP